jgi:dTDP-4-dehydrorhamnose 3,5-epimerase
MAVDWLIEGAVKDAQSITAQWNASNMTLIAGVRLHEVKHVLKGNGSLTEIYRKDWQLDDLPVEQVFEVTMTPGDISAWHAHEHTTDRLFVTRGAMRIVLYDGRAGSPTQGLVNEFKLGEMRPALVVVPPQVWHGVQNIGDAPCTLLNLVDQAYCYEAPDHWRVAHDTPAIPYRFPSLRG